MIPSRSRLPRSNDPRRRLFWLAVLVAASIGLIAADQVRLLQPLQSVVGSAAIPLMGGTQHAGRNLRDIGSFWTDLESLRSENAQLRSENEQLKIASVEQATRRSEIEELQAQLNFKQNRPDLATTPADVVIRDFSGTTQSLIIGKGQADGLRCLQPVLNPSGFLVGQVIDLQAHRATVLLITDVSSSVNVSINPALPTSASGAPAKAPTGTAAPLTVPGDGTAMGKWQLGERMHIYYIDRAATISRGDWVITSGLGGSFPRDLVVGQIDKVIDTANQTQKEATVLPTVDFANLTSVLVLNWNGTLVSPASVQTPTAASTTASGTPVPPTAAPQTGVCKSQEGQ